MTILNLEEAKKRGKILAGAWDETKYPEDEWMALCDNWDINLWCDINNDNKVTHYASIYPVKTDEETRIGKTDYYTFYSVWVQISDDDPSSYMNGI